MSEDAEELARWLATDPPLDEQDEAIDRLEKIKGGLRMWQDAARLAEVRT